jgi:hypothetical protein
MISKIIKADIIIGRVDLVTNLSYGNTFIVIKNILPF